MTLYHVPRYMPNLLHLEETLPNYTPRLVDSHAEDAEEYAFTLASGTQPVPSQVFAMAGDHVVPVQ